MDRSVETAGTAARAVAARCGWPTFPVDGLSLRRVLAAEAIREHYVSDCARHASEAARKADEEPGWKRPFWLAVVRWMRHEARQQVALRIDPEDWLDLTHRSPWQAMTARAAMDYPHLPFAKAVMALAEDTCP